MIDETNLHYFFHDTNEMKKFLARNELEFLPNRNGNFNGRLRNLHLTTYPFHNKLRVSNSIPKFFKGENHSTFSRREIQLALQEFEELIQVPLEKFEVHHLAIGFNVSLNDFPEKYLSIPISYRGKLFREYPPQQGNRIIEKICNGGEMSLKFYDKSAQFFQREKVRLNTPFLFRFETVFNKMRRLLKEINRAPLTASDLFTEPFILAMIKTQLKLFDTIDKKLEMNLFSLTPRDFCLIESFPNVPPEIKKKHKESYRKDRNHYLKLKKELQFSDLKVKELRQKFRDEADKILST